MDAGARIWLARAIKKNYWRVSGWYDLDDLMQEGYFAYYYVVRHYPQVTHSPHRMALFKLTFNSVICNLANQRTRRVEEVCESELGPADEGGSFFDGAAADPDIAEAVAELAAAPQYVRDAVALLSSGDRRLRHKPRRSGPGRRRRETLNELLCRLTGYDPQMTDIVGGIRACLGES